jgi:hypothetical protein
MKNQFLLAFIALFSGYFGQKFSVVLLIDKPYKEQQLNTELESMNLISLMEEEYLTIKMMATSENDQPMRHVYSDDKKLRKCNIILMAGVRCDPCKRLNQEINGSGTVNVYAQTSDNDFGTCDLKVGKYSPFLPSEHLDEIIKEERKKSKKVNGDYKVVFWIPSNETVTIDLLASSTLRKVDFGTEITFTAKTNSKEKTSVIMKINDELIEECSETGSTKIQRGTDLTKTIEITDETTVSLEGKGCGEPKTILVELSGKCDQIEKVKHELLYNSKSVGPLGKYASKTLDNVPCTTIKLVDNKYYMVVLNKQCGVRSYRADLIDVKTGKEYSFNLKKDINQSAIHLNGSDREDFMVFTLNHDIMKSSGVFERDDDTEPKYKMRIVPVEAIKDDLELQGNESKYETVKFQKCN